jgi:hypothetical protein
MTAQFRPNGVAANASVATNAAGLALTGKGAFVRVVNISAITSVASDVQPIVYVLFGNDLTALDWSSGSGVAATLTATNGIALGVGGDIILERPAGATHIWHIASATGRVGTSTGDMG